MGGVVTEEQAISRAQYLDLVYSQSDMIYNLIHHALFPSNDTTRPSPEAHASGMVGSVSNIKNTSSPSQTSEVNVVQSNSSQNLEERRKTRVNLRIILTHRRVPRIFDTQSKREI
jgi:hypothetical protein